MTSVVIAGVSTRAAAESAARAGFEVTAIDGYADRDQHPGVRALSMPRDFGVRFTAAAAARAISTIPSNAVVYLSNFENAPEAVAFLARHRPLWGNPPDVLRRVRDPFAWSRALRSRGLLTPKVSNEPSASNDWLVKPTSSGGGQGVRRSKPGSRLARGCYLQQYIEGEPGSIVFVAAAGLAVPLGISRQLIGDGHFGAQGFRYCGNILAPVPDALHRRAGELTDIATHEFRLAGVNGIDFVARDDVPWPVEINPRWSASMELVERAHGFSVFAAHAAACARSELPPVPERPARVHGKAIVFAKRDVVIGNTDSWLADSDVRDVPRAGERIRAGSPVCTVFAAASDDAACYATLIARAQRVYDDLGGDAASVTRDQRRETNDHD